MQAAAANCHTQLLECIGSCLSADNALRQHAERTLGQWAADPSIIAPLLSIVRSAEAVAHKQMAAVVLSQRLPHLWHRLDAEAQKQLRQSVLQLVVEPANLPCRALLRILSVRERCCRNVANCWCSMLLPGLCRCDCTPKRA